MKRSSKIIVNIMIIISCVFLNGCDIGDIENAFGLGMHSKNDDKPKDHVEVQIEYYDKDDDNVMPTEGSPKKDDSEEDLSVETDIPDPYEDGSFTDSIDKQYTISENDENIITISFAGDVCLTEGCSVLNYIKRHDNDMKNSFDNSLLDRMISSDIFMLNNEFPYSDRGAPLEGKMYTFRAAPSSASYLKDIGTDIVSLANNHCYDYGPDALIDTFKILKYIGMPYVGAGKNIEEAQMPAYFTVNNKKIAIVAATQIEGYDNPETKEATATSPGVLRCLDTARVKEVIADADKNSDFVICFVHWGTEKSDLVRSWQRSTAKDMISAGADFVIGAHSHCLQGIEYIDGVPVFYSLGNFLFNSNTQDTCLVTLNLDSSCADSLDIDSVQFIPCIQSGGQTIEANDNDRARIIKYEQGISYNASIDSNGYVSQSSVDHNIQNGKNTSPMRDE